MVVWCELVEEKWVNSRCILNMEYSALANGFEKKIKRGGGEIRVNPLDMA